MERAKDLIKKYIATPKSIYTAFAFGILWHLIPFTRPLMVYLTPFFLFTFSLISLYYSFERNILNRNLIIIFYTLTFLIELVGVRTGAVFGEYQYLWGLQPQLFNIPVVIGLMWLSLILGGFYILKELKLNDYWILIINPVIITLFDVVIEPVAIKLNYWEWTNISVPIQNYIAWYLISLAVTLSFILFKSKTTERDLIKHLFYGQLMFMVGLYLAFKVLPL